MGLQGIKYLFYSVFQPKSCQLGFVQGGLGIEERRKRYRRQWESHLAHSRALQDRWASVVTKNGERDTLIVLGAGRLYDFNDTALVPRFRKVVLVDADPSCRKSWKRLKERHPKTQVEEVTSDLTGVMEVWLERIRSEMPKNLKSKEDDLRWREALEFLNGLSSELKFPGVSPLAEISKRSAEDQAIISLNLLSQIPIYWRDTLERELLKYFSLEWMAAHESEWLLAIQEICQQLVLQHLEALSSSNAEHILLMCDVEYLNYLGHGLRRSAIDPPVEWDYELAAWKSRAEVKGISFESIDPLYGVQLNLESLFRNHKVTAKETWLWHILPPGAEVANQGTVHRILGAQLKRK